MRLRRCLCHLGILFSHFKQRQSTGCPEIGTVAGTFTEPESAVIFYFVTKKKIYILRNQRGGEKKKKEAFDFLIIKKHHCAETKEVKNRKREKEEREKSIIYNYCNENILEKENLCNWKLQSFLAQ